MKNLAICLLLLLGAVGCGDDYVVYETVDTMVCIPKNDFQVLEYDAASGPGVRLRSLSLQGRLQ